MPPALPGIHTFGANVTIVPHDAIAAVGVVEKTIGGDLARELLIDVSRGGSTFVVGVPFDGNRDAGDAVVAMLRRR